MKKLIDNMLRAAIVVLVLGVSSCQEEYEEIGGGNEEQTISANSNTAVLIQKTSSNDGSYDNIVDGASCFAVQFPYTVNVNGVEVTIDSKSDLEVIEEIFDEFDDDDNVLDIVFPITITLSDFSEITIENQDELQLMARECLEGGGDDDIECIDFVYPITLFTFDLQNQLSGEAQVESDKDMRIFFAELEENQLISVQFPITLKKYDGTEVLIESNEALAAALEMAKNECDEDDDNNYNDDDFSKEGLDELLTSCPLEVRQVIREELDNTTQYFERLLTFSDDGTVVMSNYTTADVTGTWSTEMTDSGVMLSLEFETLIDFNLQWHVYQLEEGVIKLYEDNGNKVVLKKRCDIVPEDGLDPEGLLARLQECTWVIQKVKNQGEEIDRLLGYELQFGAEGAVTLSNGVDVMAGTWEIGYNSIMILSVSINIETEAGITFEWPINDLKDSRIKFLWEPDGYEMVLNKVCPDVTDGDVTEITNIALSGPWNVALYKEGAAETTASYAGMDFDFMSMHQIEVSTSVDSIINGLWRVLRDSEEGLKFYINFDTMDELAELTEDWKVVSITSTRIELTDESGDGTLKTLVFEKP
ncbi:hypothetical protein [Flagellimonas crocea]|uniref:hypothetical protein n=1 Tax=Flagellimonas crocea TaxID=3067311 RepID=UPI00296EB93A|nr:hypothetical protein [Muricauda sp. DH64]